MTRFSLRWILLWPILLAVSIGLFALAFYVDSTARADQIASVDDELVRAEQRVVGLAPPGSPPVEVQPVETRPIDVQPIDVQPIDGGFDDDAPVILVLGADGEMLSHLAGDQVFSADELASLAGTSGYTTIGSDPRYRVRTSDGVGATTLFTALSLEQVDASIASLRRSLVLGGIVIFVIVGGIVVLISTAVTRPVTKMSRAARGIANGELDTTIDPPTGSRETADLAADLERMVARLTSSLDDATRARDDMQRFLADASHELRTPLTSLKGYSELYANDMLGEPGHLDRAMERVGSESTRLAQMVNDMLQLARDDIAPAAPTVSVDLIGVARDVVDDSSAAFPEQRIELRAGSPVPLVAGDSARLHQCLLNLVANACQHGGGGVEVVVDAQADGADRPGVTVRVVDHGAGIAPDLHDTVFLPFFRGDSSRTRDGHGGAGLGLALAKQIADRHGGTLGVEATDGGGATFVLTIPAEPPPAV